MEVGPMGPPVRGIVLWTLSEYFPTLRCTLFAFLFCLVSFPWVFFSFFLFLCDFRLSRHLWVALVSYLSTLCYLSVLNCSKMAIAACPDSVLSVII